MALYFKQYTMTATAADLATIFSTSLPDSHVETVELLAAATNAGHVYGGGSNVTNVPANAGIDLEPHAGISLHAEKHRITTSTLYVVGTAGDVLYITVIA